MVRSRIRTLLEKVIGKNTRYDKTSTAKFRQDGVILVTDYGNFGTKNVQLSYEELDKLIEEYNNAKELLKR